MVLGEFSAVSQELLSENEALKKQLSDLRQKNEELTNNIGLLKRVAEKAEKRERAVRVEAVERERTVREQAAEQERAVRAETAAYERSVREQAAEQERTVRAEAAEYERASLRKSRTDAAFSFLR